MRNPKSEIAFTPAHLNTLLSILYVLAQLGPPWVRDENLPR